MIGCLETLRRFDYEISQSQPKVHQFYRGLTYDFYFIIYFFLTRISLDCFQGHYNFTVYN